MAATCALINTFQPSSLPHLPGPKRAITNLSLLTTTTPSRVGCCRRSKTSLLPCVSSSQSFPVTLNDYQVYICSSHTFAYLCFSVIWGMVHYDSYLQITLTNMNLHKCFYCNQNCMASLARSSRSYLSLVSLQSIKPTLLSLELKMYFI